MDNQLVVYRRDYNDIITEMLQLNYNKDDKDSYDYLLNIPFRQMTKTNLTNLEQKIKSI